MKKAKKEGAEKEVVEDPFKDGTLLVTIEFYRKGDQVYARWIQKKDTDQDDLTTIAMQLEQIKNKIFTDLIELSFDAGYKSGASDAALKKMTDNNRFLKSEN